jgi:hypothetical protein
MNLPKSRRRPRHSDSASSPRRASSRGSRYNDMENLERQTRTPQALYEALATAIAASAKVWWR